MELVDINIYVKCWGKPVYGYWICTFSRSGTVKQYIDHERETSSSRLYLRAAIDGLRHVVPGEAVRVFAKSDYLIQGITHWLPQWKSNDWKRGRGKPVRNRDLWEKLDQLNNILHPQWILAK